MARTSCCLFALDGCPEEPHKQPINERQEADHQKNNQQVPTSIRYGPPEPPTAGSATHCVVSRDRHTLPTLLRHLGSMPKQVDHHQAPWRGIRKWRTGRKTGIPSHLRPSRGTPTRFGKPPNGSTREQVEWLNFLYHTAGSTPIISQPTGLFVSGRAVPLD